MITSNRRTFLGILIAIVLLFLAIASSVPLRAMGFSPEMILFVSRICIWLALAMVLLYAHHIEKQPLLLWEEKTYPLYFYVLSVMAVLGIVFVCALLVSLLARYAHLLEKSIYLEKIITLFKSNYLLMVFTCITAGVTEELLFRGYLIPRLELLFKKTYLALFVSSLAFGLLHIGYGSVMNVIGPFVIGLIFGMYYLKYRNIKVLIISHFLWDYLLLLLKTTQASTNG